MINEISMLQRRASLKSVRVNRDSLVRSASPSSQLSLVAAAIDQQEIGALRLLGLTFYEAKAYLALVKNGPLGASELSFLSHVPRTRVYGTLRLLERKGLVHAAPSRPVTFTAVSPLVALKAKAEEMADQTTSSLEVVRSLAEEYELKANSGKTLQVPKEANELWHIDGRKQVYRRVGEMLRRAGKSISYYATPAGLVRAYKVHADHLEKVEKRGVAVRFLTQTSSEVHLVAQELAAVVTIRRTTKPFDANFVCIDGEELVVIENSPDDFDAEKGADTAAWTTNRLLVRLFENLFERVWDDSLPFQ